MAGASQLSCPGFLAHHEVTGCPAARPLHQSPYTLPHQGAGLQRDTGLHTPRNPLPPGDSRQSRVPLSHALQVGFTPTTASTYWPLSHRLCILNGVMSIKFPPGEWRLVLQWTLI